MSNDTSKALYAMSCGDITDISVEDKSSRGVVQVTRRFMRVPGGWILFPPGTPVGVFIPFDNEFMQ